MTETDPPEDSPSHTHARAILTVDERIDFIAGMMERFEWVRGKSGKLLAAEWGLSVSTVEGNSAEAHRRMTADKDEAIREISVGARALYRQAVMSGNAKDAKLMGDLWADVAGAKAAIKQEVDAKIQGLATPAEAARLVREAFGDKVISSGDDTTEPDPVSEESQPE